MVDDLSIEEALSVVNVVVSCFSTVGLDAAYMMHFDPNPVSIMYLNYPKDIREFWSPDTSISEHPLVSLGIALSVNSKNELKKTLEKCVNVEEKSRQYIESNRRLPASRKSIDNFFKLIAGIKP